MPGGRTDRCIGPTRARRPTDGLGAAGTGLDLANFVKEEELPSGTIRVCAGREDRPSVPLRADVSGQREIFKKNFFQKFRYFFKIKKFSYNFFSRKISNFLKWRIKEVGPNHQGKKNLIHESERLVYPTRQIFQSNGWVSIDRSVVAALPSTTPWLI